MVAPEVSVPTSTLPAGTLQMGGVMAVDDDRVVLPFRDGAAADRVNQHYLRFRLPAQGLVLVDPAPHPLPVFPSL
jgi:hypothetical protein